MPNIRPARYIKIYADTTKGAIFFENSVVEPKFLGTVEASIKANEPDQRIVIIRNDRLRADGVTFRQIFRRLNFYRVQNADGQYLHADLGMTIEQVVDYINAEAAKSVGGAAPQVLFSKLGIIDFTLDATQTTILMSNGDQYGVNSIKAVAGDDGLIHIVPDRQSGDVADVVFYKLEADCATYANGLSCGTTVQQCVDTLNGLFSKTAIQITSPSQTLLLDGGQTLFENTFNMQDPTGDDILMASGSGYNNGRLWSTETISEPGEFFTVKIRHEGRVGIGLYDSRVKYESDGVTVKHDHYADITSGLTTPNSGHVGFWYSQWLYDYGSYIGPWTTYGSYPSLSYGPGWNGAVSSKWQGSPAQVAHHNGGEMLLKCGINAEGYVQIDYWDAGRSDDWIRLSRSTTKTYESQYGLLMKFDGQGVHVVEHPKVYRAVTLSEGQSATSNNLLGAPDVAIDGTTISDTDAAAQRNKGFYTTEFIDAPGKYFQFSGYTGAITAGLVNANEYNPEDLDDSSQFDWHVGYYSGMIIDGGAMESGDLLVDSSLSGNGVAGVLTGGNDDHGIIRIGIDLQGRYYIAKADDAGATSFSVVHRYNELAPGGNYHLVIKLKENTSTFDTANVETGEETTAPVVSYRYIQSPDGAYYWPLFASAQEANYIDTLNGGSGTSHQHVFVDDPTSSVWYMPDTGGMHAVAYPPVDLTGYTEIITLADGQFAPSPLNISDMTFTEGDSLNQQIIPQDMIATVTGLPSGLSYANGYITGTAPYVPSDYGYQITVERSNQYGSTQETFMLFVNDNAVLSSISGFTSLSANSVQPNRLILDHDALMQHDVVLSEGQELSYSYSVGQNPPTIGILNSTGQAKWDAWNPLVDVLGQESATNFAETNKWSLRYVSFGGWIGGQSTKYNLVGWQDNSNIPGVEGTNSNAQFVLRYEQDGADYYMVLYRDGVEMLRSADTYSGDQIITIAAFDDQAQSDVYIPTDWAIATTGGGSTDAPSGFVSPLTHGTMESLTVMGSDSAATMDLDIPVNHRLIIPKSWVNTNVLPYIDGSLDKAYIGVPKPTADWNDVDLHADFDAVFRWEWINNGNGTRLSQTHGATSNANHITINSGVDAFYDYAIEWDGTDLHVIAASLNTLTTEPGIAEGGSFSRVYTYSNYPNYSGTNLPVVLATKTGGSIRLSDSGLQLIRTPWSDNHILWGEGSSGNGQFGFVASSQYDELGQHAPASLSYNHPTLNAGYTYTYVRDPSLDSGDSIDFRTADNNSFGGSDFFGSATLVSRYSFHGNTGADSVSGHNMFGSATIVSNEMHFDGSNAMEVAHTADHNFSGDFSVALWVRTTQTGLGCIWQKAYGAGGGDSLINLYVNETSNKATFSWRERTANTVVRARSTTIINDGNWHHISCTKSGGTIKIIVDGTVEDTQTGAVGTANPDMDLQVGRWNHQSYPPQDHYVGSIDDLRIYSDTLSDSDANGIYAAGKDPVFSYFDYTATGGYAGFTFTVPSDCPPLFAYHYNSYNNGSFDAGRPVPISGSTHVVPVTGITIEGPSGSLSGSTLIGDAWLSIDEQLGAGERLVLDGNFLHDLASELDVGSSFSVGLKDTGWNDSRAPQLSTNHFGDIMLFIYRDANYYWTMVRHQQTQSGRWFTSLSDLQTNGGMFLEITASGNNVRGGYVHVSQNSDNESTTPYASWYSTAKKQTGDQGYGITTLDVMFAYEHAADIDTADIDWTGLSEVAVPSAPASLLTPWTKAIDFSGSAERLLQVSSSALYNPIMMNGTSQTVALPAVGYTSSNANARPWACAVVFSADGHNSNQHIWNVGEGSGSGDDNIYLRLSASKELFFGWGRDGSLNELYIGTITENRYYGVYIGFTGSRLSGSDATNINLSKCFDVRLMSAADSFVSISDQGTAAEWGNAGYSTVGGRMDRTFSGSTTIGGRGANRSFHGKVASMVVTTLKRGVLMPDDTEIKMMIRDPQQWLLDYKVGNTYRMSHSTSQYYTFALNDSASAYATQVWLMGDGDYDGFAQIRNDVYKTVQNIYPLNMISMNSNDIETVNIPGLT